MTFARNTRFETAFL